MPNQRSTTPRRCAHCGATFFPWLVNVATARYCSRPCASACLTQNRDYRRRPLAERFWGKVDKSGSCWLWTASRTPHGYGQIALDETGRLGVAPRIAWELTQGPIPDGLDVLHNCPGGDNPACVNPAHLWLGTALDNSRDMVRKGRHYAHATPERIIRGERHGRAKLTAAAVRAIRVRWSQGGVTQIELGRRFGVDNTLISLIVRGRIWRHLL